MGKGFLVTKCCFIVPSGRVSPIEDYHQIYMDHDTPFTILATNGEMLARMDAVSRSLIVVRGLQRVKNTDPSRLPGWLRRFTGSLLDKRVESLQLPTAGTWEAGWTLPESPTSILTVRRTPCAEFEEVYGFYFAADGEICIPGFPRVELGAQVGSSFRSAGKVDWQAMAEVY